MKLYEIIKRLEVYAPPKLCESWDNVGLMLGKRDQEVNRCYVALDLTDSVIDCAIRNQCNFIVTHHPFFMGGLKSIDLDTAKGKQVARLIEHNIAVYSMHTNFDSCVGGVNDILCEKLGLTDYQTDEPALCRKGSFPEAIRFRDFISLVKDVLQVTYVNYTGDLNRAIKTVAVVGGSGGGLIPIAMCISQEKPNITNFRLLRMQICAWLPQGILKQKLLLWTKSENCFPRQI